MIYLETHLMDFIKLIHDNNGDIRLIGGCIRDHLLNIENADIDLACTLHPEEMQEICLNNNLKIIPTGLQHGTITVVLNHKNYEITTLRRDVISDGRHANVNFTKNWFFDAARRDFTFNALSAKIKSDHTLEIFDYFNGQNDLKNGVLRFIGNPQQRIQEDYLRILRAIRFYARFAKKPLDNATKNAIKCEKHNISKLSGERIKNEIFNILSKKNSAIALNLIQQLELNIYIFNSNKLFNLHFLTIINKFFLTQDPLVILSLLIYFENLDIKYFVNRWKISRNEKNRIKFLNNAKNFFTINDEIGRYRYILASINNTREKQQIIEFNFIREIIENHYSESLILNSYKNYLSHVDNIKIKPLPINGENFQHLSGKDIGIALEKANLIWHYSNYQLSIAELMHKLEQ